MSTAGCVRLSVPNVFMVRYREFGVAAWGSRTVPPEEAGWVGIGQESRQKPIVSLEKI